MAYKIVKTKSGKFRVYYYGNNGEMLAHSELLNSKQSAKKNISAMENVFTKSDLKCGLKDTMRLYIHESINP